MFQNICCVIFFGGSGEVWGVVCRQSHYRELVCKFNFMLYVRTLDIKCMLGAASTPAV